MFFMRFVAIIGSLACKGRAREFSLFSLLQSATSPLNATVPYSLYLYYIRFYLGRSVVIWLPAKNISVVGLQVNLCTPLSSKFWYLVELRVCTALK